MMFAWSSKGLRSRAALVAAALYAFCVVAPNTAIALGSAVHCLTDSQPVAHVHKAKADVTTHTYSDGTVHHHGGKAADHDNATDPHDHSEADEKSGTGNCCGLFCISAIAADTGPTLIAPVSFAADLPAMADALTGRDPGLLHRPPIR